MHIFDDKILTGTDNGQVFVSFDHGNYWIDISNGLIGSPVLSLYVFDDFLYAGMNTGLSRQVFPPIIPDIPQNVIISIDLDSINIMWDEVTGATSYKVSSSNDPYTGFVEDISGTFDETSWSAPISTVKKFYYVTANN